MKRIASILRTAALVLSALTLLAACDMLFPKQITYTVIYHANQASSGSVPATQVKRSGIALNIAANTGNLLRIGYGFDGWNTRADGSGTDYAAGSSYQKDADLELFAKWKSVITVGMLTEGSSLQDGIFTNATWIGIQKAVLDFSLEQMEYRIPSGTTDEAYLAAIGQLYDAGCRLIIAPGFMFASAVHGAQTLYPDAKFILIDAVPHSGNGVADIGTNTVAVFFAEHESGFLAGVAAAAELETGKFGFIGGMEIPAVQKFNWGFQRGVHYANTNITGVNVTMDAQDIVYQDSFDNMQAGRDLAAAMYDRGVDLIFTAAGGVGTGAIAEAKARAEEGQNVWVVGVDNDEYDRGLYSYDSATRSVILTSALKRADHAAYLMVQAQLQGNFPGGQVLTLDAGKDGIGIPQTNPNLSTEAGIIISAVYQKMKNKELVVLDNAFTSNSGILELSVYGQQAQNIMDTEGKTLEVIVDNWGTPLESLIRIVGLTPEYYMADRYGRLTIHDIAPGTYTIHPVFMNSNLDRSVTIPKVGTVSETIILPLMQVETRVVHATLHTVDIRRGLAAAIKRQELLSVAIPEPQKQACFAALPSSFSGDGLLLTALEEDADKAATLLPTQNPISFTLRYNTNASHTEVGNALKTQWESFAGIDLVTLADYEWQQYLDTILYTGNFEIARFGWGFSSNNPLEYFERIMNFCGYSSAPGDYLISQLEAAKSAGDVAAIIDLVSEFHELVLDEGLVIPLWEIMNN
jgi:basic membrane protein A